MVTKTTKLIPMNMLLTVMVLILSGCLNTIEIPKASPSVPTPTKIVSLPGVTTAVPVITTTLPPYPTSSENFIKTPSISGAEARKIIIEKGAGGDLDLLEKWYKSEGIVGSGMSNFVVPVVYNEGGHFNWDLMVKKNNGNFVKFTLTSGPESGELVRGMGMIRYLKDRPSFEVSELQDPAGMGNVNQQVIWDRSGWSVIGAFQGNTLVAWFNADAPNGGEWIKLQEIVPTATPAATEIPFDTSRFEVVDATDGNKYQGYVIEGEFGTRLVDDANSIILVKDGDIWKPAESRNYSEEYPAVFYETKIGKADGFEIPITLGLARNVREGIGFNFTEIHMTELGADAVASFYLHLAWGRYNILMNHSDMSYESYLDLLRQGKGNLEIYDAIAKENILIDPRQGLSLVITGDRTKSMPIWFLDNAGMYHGSDEKGRLLTVENSAYDYHSDTLLSKKPRDVNAYVITRTFSSISLLSFYPDKCFKNGSIVAFCPNVEEPPMISDIGNELWKYAVDFNNYKSDDPLFTLK